MKLIIRTAFSLALTFTITAAIADILVITTSKDNTLYERAAGDRSNGQGAHFFAGRTGNNNGFILRRGLIAFDFSGIPAGSVIDQVSLRLTLSQAPPGGNNVDIGLHTADQDWGEGASDAGEPGGSGTGAAVGDATWLHTFSATTFWTDPGGDFAVAASASTTVNAPADYVWTSAQMITDVQNWVDTPSSNFGWLVLGQEFNNTTARRFDSKEHADMNARPQLTIDFTAPAAGPALAIPALGLGGILLLMLGLLGAALVFRSSKLTRNAPRG